MTNNIYLKTNLELIEYLNSRLTGVGTLEVIDFESGIGFLGSETGVLKVTYDGELFL